MKNLIVTSFIAFGLAGCATSAQTFQFENSKISNKSFDETWEGVISYFAENNIGIKTLEKSSGIIAAENARMNEKLLNEFASCAVPTLGTVSYGTANYNVFARKVDANNTKVQVNMTFAATMPPGGMYAGQTVECNSNGKLETAMLDSITR